MLTRRYREGRLIRARTLRAATLANVRNSAVSGIADTMQGMRWALCLAFLKRDIATMNDADLLLILAAFERIGNTLDRIEFDRTERMAAAELAAA